MKNEQTYLPDEINPQFLFSTTSTELLLQIANGEIDANELALQELRNRRIDFAALKSPQTMEVA